MKRLHWPRGFTCAHRDIASRRGSDGGQAAPIGDWVSSNPALPVSCGSCSALTYTSSVNRRVHGMLLFPLCFHIRSAGDPGTLLIVPPGCARDSIVRDAAHPRGLLGDPVVPIVSWFVLRHPLGGYPIHYGRLWRRHLPTQTEMIGNSISRFSTSRRRGVLVNPDSPWFDS